MNTWMLILFLNLSAVPPQMTAIEFNTYATCQAARVYFLSLKTVGGENLYDGLCMLK